MRVESIRSSAIPDVRDESLGFATAHAIRAPGVRDLEVAINGATRQFEATAGDGAMRNAMVGSLDTVAGLTAAIRPDGRLVLVTDDARQLVIASLMRSPDGVDALAGAIDTRPSDRVAAYLDAGAVGTPQGPATTSGTVRPR